MISCQRPVFAAICLIACCGGLHGQIATPEPGLTVSPIIGVVDQTPGEFLETLGKAAKARWRLLFRPPPPTPSTDRCRSALVLGSLIGESYLIWQAGDSQQYRNTNQEMVNYCRTLGLGEKMMPRLMAQGKMAEMEHWKELQQEIAEGHQELQRLLREMQDEDLALLIDTGLWLRLLEVSSTLIADLPGAESRHLCIGSNTTLQLMRDRFDRISEKMRQRPLLQLVQAALFETQTVWLTKPNELPSAEAVLKTRQRFGDLMQAMWEKEK
jgi:hypothetical protein